MIFLDREIYPVFNPDKVITKQQKFSKIGMIANDQFSSRLPQRSLSLGNVVQFPPPLEMQMQILKVVTISKKDFYSIPLEEELELIGEGASSTIYKGKLNSEAINRIFDDLFLDKEPLKKKTRTESFLGRTPPKTLVVSLNPSIDPSKTRQIFHQFIQKTLVISIPKEGEKIDDTGFKNTLLVIENLKKHNANFKHLLIYHEIEYEGKHAFLTEYLKGLSLEKFLFTEQALQNRLEISEKKENNLNGTVLLNIVKSVAEGMEELHSSQVIHSDLRLKNILIENGKSGEQIVKIADFDRSKIIFEDKETSIIQGTERIAPIVTPPEYFKEKSISKKIDSWAFGLFIVDLIMKQENVCFSSFSEERPEEIKDFLTKASFLEIGKEIQKPITIIKNFLKFSEKKSPHLEKLINIAEKCLKIDPRERLNFTEVLKMINSIVLPSEAEWPDIIVVNEKTSSKSPLIGGYVS